MVLAACCEKVGETPLRIYLTGRMLVKESSTVIFDERRLMEGEAASPRTTLLGFMESAYGGARAAG